MNERIFEFTEHAGMTIGQELKIVSSGMGVGRSIQMNERIKELIKQCTSWSEGSTWTSHEEFDKEKFAELIVRECINIAYEYDKPKLSGPGLAIASNIESHFDIYIEEDGRFVK